MVNNSLYKRKAHQQSHCTGRLSFSLPVLHVGQSDDIHYKGEDDMD